MNGAVPSTEEAAATDLDAYVAKWRLDEDIAARLRRLTPTVLRLVTQKDLSDVHKPSAMLNMRCNRFEKLAEKQSVPLQCVECDGPDDELDGPGPGRAERAVHPLPLVLVRDPLSLRVAVEPHAQYSDPRTDLSRPHR